MGRANRNRVTAALAGILLAGCASSGPGSLATDPPTVAPSVDTTLAALTTVAATEPPATAPPTTPPAVTDAPSTTAPPACSATAVPGEAIEIHELTADVDGDGLPDRLRTFGLPTADGLMRWRARLDTGSGTASDLELDDAFDPVQPLGTVQIDRDLTAGIGLADEVLLSVGSTADGLAVQVVSVDGSGCLLRLGDALGGITTFTVGTGPDRLDGLQCESDDGADRLVARSAVRATTTSFTTSDTRMQRVGPNLLPETVAEGTASADGDVLARYGMVDCPGISLPG